MEFVLSGATRELTAELPVVDWTHVFYMFSISLGLIGDVLIPVLFFRFERLEQRRREGLERQRAERQQEFGSVHKRMDHLDECFDMMRQRVLGEVASRKDFDALRAEIETTLNRMRAAISGETSELGKRIYRLEDKAFRQ